jgi:hypothetical protein
VGSSVPVSNTSFVISDVRVNPVCTIGPSDRRGKTKRTTMRVEIEGGGVSSTRKERMHMLSKRMAAPLLLRPTRR